MPEHLFCSEPQSVQHLTTRSGDQWFRWHKVRRTPVVILENVKQCPLWWVTVNMGQDYIIVPLYVDPTHVCCDHFGRPRVYFVMIHMEEAIVLADVKASYSSTLTVTLDYFAEACNNVYLIPIRNSKARSNYMCATAFAK